MATVGMPDLPSFRVVKPSDRLTADDVLNSTLPDGRAKVTYEELPR